jgi:hypothetical protein
MRCAWLRVIHDFDKVNPGLEPLRMTSAKTDRSHLQIRQGYRRYSSSDRAQDRSPGKTLRTWLEGQAQPTKRLIARLAGFLRRARTSEPSILMQSRISTFNGVDALKYSEDQRAAVVRIGSTSWARSARMPPARSPTGASPCLSFDNGPHLRRSRT